MSPRPQRTRPGGQSALIPQVQSLAVGSPEVGGPSSTARSVSIDRVAVNPLNARDIDAHPDELATLAESMRKLGQLQPCAVVTVAAFTRCFPDHADDVAGADWVQVTGARRRAAALAAGITTLDIVVKDSLATGRAHFIAATAAENFDRANYDPVEEAHQVRILVREAGTNAAAADQLGMTGAWVTQRLNLLKLVPEVQTSLRAGQVGVRGVRNFHRFSPQEQLVALRGLLAAAAARAERERREDEDQPEEKPRPAPRPSPVARAVQRLGDTPDRKAESLWAELPADEVRALVEALLRRLG